MLIKIKKAISWLKYNPNLFIKHLIIQIKKFTPLPKSITLKKINGVLFEFDFNYDAAIKSMYTGGYEMDIVDVMKKVLKEGDTFIDVGANIGYISSVAAGFVGKTGEVHSFEPVPEYFYRLKNMADLNSDYKIKVNQCALGEKCGQENIKISNLNNIGWNTMVPNFLKDGKKVKEILKIPVIRLDKYIKDKALMNISLIKIDVEGFEFPVLMGLSDYFIESKHRPIIICEINPFACSLLGYELGGLSDFMNSYGYSAYNLLNLNIKLDITKFKETTDVVFISYKR